jgi:hypothetical protein
VPIWVGLVFSLTEATRFGENSADLLQDHHIRRYTESVCLSKAEVMFGHLSKVVPARFLYYKVTTSTFVTNDYLQGDTLRV